MEKQVGVKIEHYADDSYRMTVLEVTEQGQTVRETHECSTLDAIIPLVPADAEYGVIVGDVWWYAESITVFDVARAGLYKTF